MTSASDLLTTRRRRQYRRLRIALMLLRLLRFVPKQQATERCDPNLHCKEFMSDYLFLPYSTIVAAGCLVG